MHHFSLLLIQFSPSATIIFRSIFFSFLYIRSFWGNPNYSLLYLYKHMSTTTSWNEIVFICLYHLLRGLMELGASEGQINIVHKLGHYLVSPIFPAHQKTFTSIAFSSHSLAIKRLCWRKRYRTPVLRKWCLCNFCHARVEDKVHALNFTYNTYIYDVNYNTI